VTKQWKLLTKNFQGIPRCFRNTITGVPRLLRRWQLCFCCVIDTGWSKKNAFCNIPLVGQYLEASRVPVWFYFMKPWEVPIFGCSFEFKHWTLKCFRMQRFEGGNQAKPPTLDYTLYQARIQNIFSWDKCRRFIYSIKDVVLWFSMWFCKKKSNNRYYLPRKVCINDQISTWQYILSIKRVKVKEILAEIVASCSKLLFCKVTRETTQKGPTYNAKLNPLHLSQTKNPLEPGLM